MGRMIIAVDPHKASVTIEVVDGDGKVAATGRFETDQRSYRNLLTYVRRWPHRVWAVEGAEGAGRPFTQRLLADGEKVRDVPAKLAARVRALDTGQGRKTDPLTELRGGVGWFGGRLGSGVDTVPDHDRRQGRPAGSVAFGGAAAWPAGGDR